MDKSEVIGVVLCLLLFFLAVGTVIYKTGVNAAADAAAAEACTDTEVMVNSGLLRETLIRRGWQISRVIVTIDGHIIYVMQRPPSVPAK